MRGNGRAVSRIDENQQSILSTSCYYQRPSPKATNNINHHPAQKQTRWRNSLGLRMHATLSSARNGSWLMAMLSSIQQLLGNLSIVLISVVSALVTSLVTAAAPEGAVTRGEASASVSVRVICGDPGTSTTRSSTQHRIHASAERVQPDSTTCRLCVVHWRR